jgi:small subunit ribosomal protein S2
MKLDRETKNMIAILAFIAGIALAINYIVVPNADQSFISWSVGLFVVAVMFWIWIRRDDLAEKRAESLKAAEEAARQAEDLAQKTQDQAQVEIEFEEEKVNEVTKEVEEPVTEEPAVEVDEPVAETPATSKPTEPDNLTKVEGIGPAYAKLLVAAGVTTFAQLASKSQADLEKIIKDAGKRRPASVSTWAEQAGLAAKGDWDGLKKLQDSLDGGRRK